MCKQMDVFAFSQEAQFFLKARCARLEPWHLLPPRARRQHALTSKQLLTARCAARAFLFAVCAAAVLRAHQLCSWSTSRSKSKERGAWSIGKKSAACTALQCKLQPTLWNSASTPFFPKEMAIFTPPLAKFSPAARIIDPPPAGRRCAARIGYPNRHHHPCMVQHGRRCPGTFSWRRRRGP